ncbi:MAG: hypothetical protein JWR33_2539 [Naasia sp.]|uniref:YceD family protein n=1 Tax=Naasia sp. TaxID=2546198 RepID=UPI0026290408|nr:DUF177 domain-containing protein [Naasia sp.]MCU1571798.1 hypothetical protein [Naasia sp.]
MTAKNPYLVNVRDIVNRPGEQREKHLSLDVPEKLGEGLAWVAEGRHMEIRVRLESVHEGILVTGEVDTVADAQSARTLTDFEMPIEVEFQELFAYSSEVPSDDYEVQGDQVDLEQVVRDAVVLSLPFQPEIAGETDQIELAEGVTLVLADDEREAPLDERWAALAALREQTDVSTEEER